MKYFTIAELTASATATARKINNTPNETVKSHLIQLIEKLLDPIREQWAAYCKANNLGSGAIKVNSGYRCPALNKAVGGVSTSAHMVGYAADIRPANGKQVTFEKWISTKFIKSGIIFDQIIIEKSKTSRWVHVGYKNQSGLQRKSCFRLTV